jgi:putative protease
LVTDEDGGESIANCVQAKEKTKNNESIIANIKAQLSKTGNTPYIAEEIEIQFSENWFLPISKINELRRSVYEQLSATRSNNYKREEFPISKTSHPYPETELDFTYNISNKLARKFYERHGAQKMDQAIELQTTRDKACVMTTKYCIKYELDQCPKYHKNEIETKLIEPLILTQGKNEYQLKFNCGPCEMEIWEKDDKKI